MKDKTKTNKLNKNSGQPELTQLICDLAPQKKKIFKFNARQLNVKAWKWKKKSAFFLKKLKTRTKVKLDESLKPVRPGSQE